jgi:RNA polymerase sigma-70 factor (ECF subfamily)
MAAFPQTRASLLLRLRDSRDEAAWREFVELYAPLVYGYARRRGLQDADAADLCQDVLTAVAGSLRRLDYDATRGAFRNWLFTIVRRKLADWLEANGKRAQGSGDSAMVELLSQCPAPQGQESEWEQEWEARVFSWACEQVRCEVSYTTWHAFWCTGFQGQPGKQVAAELGLSVAAVYLARSRVLARLKELVQSVQGP